MHFFGVKEYFFGGHGIVGAHIGTGAGLAFAEQYKGTDNVCLTFFGDGASSQGVLHESMNLASIWKLPVVFVCENNGWAESTPASYSVSVADIASRAIGYSMPGVVVDATDYQAMHSVAQEAVDRARNGGGPTFIEAKFARHVGHFVGDGEPYRSRENRSDARSLDVIATTRLRLESLGVNAAEIVAEVEKTISIELEDAFSRARQDEWPSIDGLELHVFND